MGQRSQKRAFDLLAKSVRVKNKLKRCI